jgi:hypothetical protein
MAAEGEILVTGITGPLEEHWHNKVQAFVSQVLQKTRTG